jgi:ElaB/YqjD/DUF883 family membrane-anchored ribosome-binding protein
MAEREHLTNTTEADVERSTEHIRRDIAKGEANISRTVEKIDERIQEKLDWREYVKDSPYWALGAAAGLGYLASRMLITRTTLRERIMGSIAEEVRDSLGGLIARAAGPGLVKVTLLGIAAKAAAGWVKSATSTPAASSGAGPRPQTRRVSTISPKVDT